MWWRHLRDGGTTRGSRGEEGTYRNKFPVPASRTLSEKKVQGKEIERQRNEDGKDNISTDTTRGKSSSVEWTKIPAKPKKWKAGHHSPSKISYRCWDVWLGMIQTILFMGKLTWCLHEHEWWGFNELLSNICNSNCDENWRAVKKARLKW